MREQHHADGERDDAEDGKHGGEAARGCIDGHAHTSGAQRRPNWAYARAVGGNDRSS